MKHLTSVQCHVICRAATILILPVTVTMTMAYLSQIKYHHGNYKFECYKLYSPICQHSNIESLLSWWVNLCAFVLQMSLRSLEN